MDTRYSRQELIFGQGCMSKLKDLHVYIYGNGSCMEQELTKNLAMMGVGNITIESDPTVQRYFAVDMNPDTKITFVNGYLKDMLAGNHARKNINVVIICNFIHIWNNIDYTCYFNNIWFIGCTMNSIYGGSLFWSRPPPKHEWITEASTTYYIESIIPNSREYFLYTEKELLDISEGEVIVFNDNQTSAQIISIDNKCVKVNLLDLDQTLNSQISFQRKAYTNKWTENYKHKGWEFLNNLDIFGDKDSGHSTTYATESYLGAIVANEAIKYIGLGIPYKNGFVYNSGLDISSYKKIGKKRFALIGAGAIGCEMLKNFAHSDLSFKIEVEIFDMDYIEKSNLSRQVLFSQESLSMPKAIAAKQAIDKLNNKNITVNANVVRIDNTNIEKLFHGIDCIIGAVDTIDTRKLLDKYAVWYKVPYFDAGLSGLKGHLQSIIPNKTESFVDLNDIDSSTNEIVDCTVKKFPYTFMHCIKWAEDYCNSGALPTKEEFKKIFIDNIEELQKMIPIDAVDSAGDPFWSSNRKFPKVGDMEDAEEWINVASDLQLWIYVSSKNRAKNYQIEEMPFIEYKKLKIIPSCITTASCVSALCTIEILKLFLTPNYTSKNSFFNLGNNLHIESDSSLPIKIKQGYSSLMCCDIVTIPGEFSKWDRIKFPLSDNKITIRDFISQLGNKYNINIDKIINFNGSVYDEDIGDSGDSGDSGQSTFKKGDILEISGYNKDNNLVLMPKIILA